ncbi:hypothetical protein C8035_v012253 [Colletotrichum spinosum]|uniref:Uncharacterized protein n=1 Tax=Colletotrichum spinosum TaxID=1347390 RepID=A0A4R8Q0R7_9PEZI|nr:hypothetical protein C8035_v012253 [Colletotrichum spinosum]
MPAHALLLPNNPPGFKLQGAKQSLGVRPCASSARSRQLPSNRERAHRDGTLAPTAATSPRDKMCTIITRRLRGPVICISARLPDPQAKQPHGAISPLGLPAYGSRWVERTRLCSSAVSFIE